MTYSHEWTLNELKHSETNTSHRPPDEEYAFYNAVRDGDMDAVKKNLAHGAFTAPEGMGILSRDSLRNLRYHFVISVSMITRYCVDGGMEAEKAYRLSDFYILKMDEAGSTKEIAELHKDMVLDFTGNMLLLKRESAVSKPVAQCIDYIYSHLNERITINTLADYTGLSQSYLSRIFKQTLGISISDYIRERKIEKALDLLRFSDLSLIDIANYLAFSSQSHFIQTFEHFVGKTPKKFRDEYYRKVW